ncbi:sensor domain-containing diguanylate cyclase [Arsukibacterium indicum]|uniref:diguanylate cyclase n=1 Tax=Arsukibacterium indicum TaxID=2848612 RepID=A0ABS6MKU0_9GAMM|nr:sensor domain-containing diguanylate cyclase [Arsukibacterium indicum]MBV2128989.1 sensor domain-containing diguanylate cyclase [Arsukibacterium indicum]
MDKQLEQLAQFVATADSVEGLTRPLLALLQRITGLESTYLTAIDETAGVQHILIAHNAGVLQLPESLTVPWQDTLCKRALESKQFVTEDVAACWGDSDAARELGLKSYISVPVMNQDGSVFGTLCGASSHNVELSTMSHLPELLQLCADLIAHQLNRESQAKLAAERAAEAELQLNRVSLFAKISELCMAGQSLSLAIGQTAEYMLESGFCSRAVAFDLINDELVAVNSQDEPWNIIVQALRNELSVETRRRTIIPLTIPEGIQQQFGGFLQAGHDTLLIKIFAEDTPVALMFVQIAPSSAVQAENRALLSAISNSLSLLASRLADHNALTILNQQLEYQAQHDTLTALPNRRYLFDELARQLSRATRQQLSFYILFIDLDGFKLINDSYGHETGDEFLRQFAKRIRKAMRSGDFAARHGGDEFVMLCQYSAGSPAELQAEQLVKRIRAATSGTFELAGVTLDYNGPSLGVLQWRPGDITDGDQLLSQADAAMYQDKQQRRKLRQTKS